MRRLLLPLALALAAGCDTPAEETDLTFQSVTVAERGDASLAVSGGALVVSGLDGSRSGGFTVAGTPGRVDVEIDPLAIPAGGRFGVEVEDAAGADLASFYTEAASDGSLDFVYDFGGTLPVLEVAIRYRLGGEAGDVVFQEFVGVPSGRVARRAPTSGGSGDGETGSTHVIRENGKYIVVSDSDSGGARRAGECPGFLVTPPPPFDGQFRTPLCTDWIEIEPFLAGEGGAMGPGTVSVTARGVGAFIVRDLDAESY